VKNQLLLAGQALGKAARVFRSYQELHRSKVLQTSETRRKAEENGRLADEMEKALKWIQNQDQLSDPCECLAQFCDLAVKLRPIRKWPSEVRTGANEAYCIFCNDTGRIPPEVQHKHGCIVARARNILNQ